MSSTTTCAVVPFKYKDRNWNNPLFNGIMSNIDEDEATAINNWKYSDYTEYVDQNKNRLYCGIALKNNFKVYIVNEAQYANGGERSYCVFSEDLNSLTEFCNDLGLNINWITINNTVQQTL